MKQATVKASNDLRHKIESIEKEVFGLKLMILKKLSPSPKKIISLKGIIRGVTITDKDIEDAKRSLYDNVVI
jgi:hypothetical protein